MFLPIFICEDDTIHAQNLKHTINQTIINQRMSMEIVHVTNNASDLLEKVAQKPAFGIYFLDIELSGSSLNGLALASEIRKYDPDGYIIFVTTHSEMTYLTFQYKVNALDFIIKEDFQKMNVKVAECLEIISKRVKLKSKNTSDLFTLENDKELLYLPYDCIYYFEAYANHRILLHCKDQQIDFSDSLKKIEQRLDSYFFRSHKSCIVNIRNILKLDLANRLIYFTNSETCVVSRTKMKELKILLNR